MNKKLLNGLTKVELLKVAKNIGATGLSKLAKDEILDEVCMTIGYIEVADNVTLSDNQIESLKENSIDDVLNMEYAENIIKAVEECNVNGVVEVELEDFNTQKELTQALDLEFFEPHVKTRIFATLKVVGKKYSEAKDYSIEPFTKLVEAMAQLRIADRSVAFAFSTLKADIKAHYDYKAMTQDDILEVIEKYNEEENAKLQLFINDLMRSKQPSEKQIEYANSLMELIQKIEGDIFGKLVKSGEELLANFSASSFDFKVWCDSVNGALNKQPASEGQLKFLKSMVSVGIKLNLKDLTYGEASKLIKDNLELFNRKSLVKSMNNFGVIITEESIVNMDSERVKKYNFAMSRVGSTFKLASQFTGENIWRLLDKLISMSAVELCAIQNACVTKDMEYIYTLI